MSVKTLKEVRDTLHKIDTTLRNQKKCPNCGKPMGGIVYAGQTKESAGLCTCEPTKEVQDGSK